ncbi:MAG: TetR/AcrR family transcriptional regulator [Erysipelotrichaceae bacterium]|nr:TetR/AcrR family transcriptional regulator [Erysipelotrichaceae bacterium]
MRISKDSEERRNELIEAAEKLFAENGIANTAVSAIVKEVNVAQGLFYYYFKSKDDVIEAISRKYAEEFREILQSNLEMRSFEQDLDMFLDNALISFAELWHKFHHPDEIRDLVQLSSMSLEEAKKAAVDALVPILDRGLIEGKVTIADPNILARIVVSGICDLCGQNTYKKEDIKEVVETIIRKGD